MVVARKFIKSPVPSCLISKAVPVADALSSSIATREAIEKGVSQDKIVRVLPDGTKVSEFDEVVAKRYAAGFDETGLIALDKEASRYAKEVTFTKELDGILGYIQRITNEVPIIKQILPFVKTPANLAIEAVSS